MKCLFLPVFNGINPKPVGYVGPTYNLKTVARKHLTRPQKMAILERQRSRCNSCGDRIQLYPYAATCDADHIIGVCRGGDTVLHNTQCLCVRCHRAKSSREASAVPRMIELPLSPSDRNVYIFTRGDTIAFPVDKRTPLEAITNGCTLSLLSYKKVDRTFVEPTYEEVDFEKMLQKFVYTPRNSFDFEG